jgi:hypothetical protein
MAVRYIADEAVLTTIERPQERIPTGRGRHIYQGRYFDTIEQKEMLLRVVIEPQGDNLVVVSVYKTSRIWKYWHEEQQG